jgi:molecular chaperone HtpG
VEPIRIGKFTLESLTTGMYADPRIIFREYIQNSTDAIDKAIKERIIKREEGRIDITIDKLHRKIIIRDNGIGIPNSKVWHLLGDIVLVQRELDF